MKKVIEINITDYISVFLNNLLVKSDNGNITIPLKQIETLILNNSRSNVSVSLISNIIKEDINFIICDEKHLPIASIIRINGNYDNSRFIKQLSWTNEFKAKIWKEIIKLKIQNSFNLLQELDLFKTIDDCKKFLEYRNNVLEGDLTNREGHAAKVYFNLLFGKNFDRRSENKINHALNYGYSILLSYISRCLISSGLDNRVSIWHNSKFNSLALACDLIEPFRSQVDYLVYKMYINEEQGSLDNFKEGLFNLLDMKVSFNGKMIKFQKMISQFIHNFEKLNYQDFIADFIKWEECELS